MYKKSVYIFLTLSLLLTFSYGFFMYQVDPYQQYRMATYYKPYFILQRYMMAGLAKNLDYETALVGEICLLDNFNVGEVDEIMKTKSAKLNLQGGSPYGTKIILDTIFQNNKDVKQIIYGLPVTTYFEHPDKLSNAEGGDFPLYLYDKNIFNDYRYLLSVDTLFAVIKTFVKDFFGVGVYSNDINTAYHWVDDMLDYGNDNIKKQWDEIIRQNVKSISKKERKKDLMNMIENFEKNILPHIKDNKKVHFKLYFIPYSIAYISELRKKGKLENFLYFREYVVTKLNGYKNVVILDFQMDLDLISNFKFYKDIIHYSKEVNRKQIDYIKNNNFLVNEQTIKNNNKKILEVLKESIKDNGYTYTKPRI